MTVTTTFVDFFAELARSEGFSATWYEDATTHSIGYGFSEGAMMRWYGQGRHNLERLSRAEADVIRAELVAWEYGKCVEEAVTAPTTALMREALVLLVYNIGCSAFRRSTLLRLLNAAQYEQAAKEFDEWIWAEIDGVDQPVNTARRAKERARFEAGLEQLYAEQRGYVPTDYDYEVEIPDEIELDDVLELPPPVAIGMGSAGLWAGAGLALIIAVIAASSTNTAGNVGGVT